MKKVQILLSSYNGEQYIAEQLDSILSQDYSGISILIRDDGSTDRTINIIKKYAENYEQISCYKGENLGVINSFFDLLDRATLDADYYALSDQDDVWLKDKISRAVSKLLKMDNSKPLLYCGKTTPVDEDLRIIPYKIKPTRIKPDFTNALVENICTGCTSVFNRELLLMIRQNKPSYTVMHDWWLYLVASSIGKVYYDYESRILYRQHKSNLLGMKTNYIDEFIGRLKRYHKNKGNISRQALEFNKKFKVDNEKQILLDYIINSSHNFISRLKILKGKRIYRQRKLDNYIFKVLIIFGRV